MKNPIPLVMNALSFAQEEISKINMSTPEGKKIKIVQIEKGGIRIEIKMPC